MDVVLVMVAYFFFPAILLALVVGLAPLLYALSQRSPTTRRWLLLGNAGLCFVLTVGAIVGLETVLGSWVEYSEVVNLSFDGSIYSHVPGVTAENVGQYEPAVYREVAYRELFTPWTWAKCFSSDAAVCQLSALALRPPTGMDLFSLLALLPTGLNVVMTWLFTRPRAEPGPAN